GKFIKSGEIRYLPKTKKYQLTGTTTDGKSKLTFDGTLKDEKLSFERTDPKTKETQQILMNTAAEGVRFIYQVKRQTGPLWKLEYMVAATKLGKSLGKKEKGPECIVSGGRGTMTVSYGSETFYVCCTGCRDEFNANPKKYIEEWKKKKK